LFAVAGPIRRRCRLPLVTRHRSAQRGRFGRNLGLAAGMVPADRLADAGDEHRFGVVGRQGTRDDAHEGCGEGRLRRLAAGVDEHRAVDALEQTGVLLGRILAAERVGDRAHQIRGEGIGGLSRWQRRGLRMPLPALDDRGANLGSLRGRCRARVGFCDSRAGLSGTGINRLQFRHVPLLDSLVEGLALAPWRSASRSVLRSATPRL
jgi:hypothetical protein